MHGKPTPGLVPERAISSFSLRRWTMFVQPVRGSAKEGSGVSAARAQRLLAAEDKMAFSPHLCQHPFTIII
jgi:hypothetical protein